MTVLAPLALFFLISVPFVILLYLLKLRRIDKPISSTLLWRQSLEDLKANTPFQKLRTSLLLLLQLLVLIFLSIALARPALRYVGLEARSLIVLLDTSASMSCTDVSPSRLEHAKKQIQTMIDDLAGRESMMLITFSQGSQVLCPFTNDRRALTQTLRPVETTDQSTDIEEAFGMALAAARSQTHPEIYVFSDGGFPSLKLDQEPEAPIRFVSCGSRGENVGITAVGTRRDFDAEGRYQITATIRNSSSAPQELYVEVYALASEEGEKLIDAREVSIDAGESKAVILEDPGYYVNALEIRLAVDDDLSVDNRAFVILPRKEAVKVLVVSTGSFFLERALNIDPRTAVSVIAPNEYISGTGYDLVVFDGYSPPRLGPGRYLFMACAPPYPDCSLGEQIERPVVIDWDRLHPLTRYLELSNLIINKTQVLNLPSWAKVLVESHQTPLMALMETGSTSSVIIGFDLYDSDWPLRASFPILFMNLLDWFISTDPWTMRLFSTGDVILLPPMEAETDAAVRLPSGQLRGVRLHADEATPFADTSEAGLYALLPQEGDPLFYACNLTAPSESDTTPRTRFSTGTADIEAEPEIGERNREIWWPLAVCALILFLVEWLVYTRRARYGI
ncbi:MAG: BatA and WFA domain-containing protein [bacterium]